MGIPSFYRHLVKTNPKLISQQNGGKPSVLALDLNCAIYHCLSKLQKKTPYVANNRIAFENALIQSVVLYIVKLRDHVQPSDLLYVAVDGVVPMAKIRQQRMRRFKSVWVSAEESKIKGEESVGWDRNSITPGTEFMDRLCEKLSYWARNQKNTIVSGVRESGEGEQKIMSFLRSNPPKGEVIVYGLDADLIVLCLWHFKVYGWSFKLLREDVEMKGGVKLNSFGEETLLYFDIDMLASIITSKWNVGINDYVGAMSFLGNDFIPHGLTLCIREEGIDRLMEILEMSKETLVFRDNDGVWKYNIKTLQYIIGEIVKIEDRWLLSGLAKKLKMSAHGYSKPGAEPQSDVEKALTIMNSLPLTWKVERCIADRNDSGWYLKDNWETTYYNEFLWGADPANVNKEWLKGIQWVLNYYTGSKPVDFLWYYPWYLPPLFKDIQMTENAFNNDNEKAELNPIQPISQLLMVLPIESYALIPNYLRRLPFLKPEYYPRTWTFFSAGRRQLWECEPMIPMLPYNIVARFIKNFTR
jgi:5'-3' exonuclease